MFTYYPHMNIVSGEKVSTYIEIDEKISDGIHFVYASAISNSSTPEYDGSLNPDCGLEIKLETDKKIEGFMANYRHNEFWCKPYFGINIGDVPDETQTLVIRLEDGDYCVILPVVNDKYKCVFCGGNNELKAKLYSWYEHLYECNGLCFTYSVGKNPFELMSELVKHTANKLKGRVRIRSERRYPEIFEYLGWCSWDSMQIRVDEEGLLQKCEEFSQKNIPVKWVIIDDMWAEIRDFYDRSYDDFAQMINLMYRSRMYHFDADPKRFPDGLKGIIEKINKYNIDVGVWHPTTGYWHGYDENGTAYRILKDYLFKTSTGYIIPDWHTEKSYMYYKTIHDFFLECGAKFVKIDNQSMIRRFYKGLAPIGKIAKSFHDGMEASVGEHFDNQMINCMGMASEDMWNRSISPISRCSDDFKPDNREWFVNHIMQCSYNSFVQGQFYYCDWDMWWTNDGQALKNSVIRAISGGPIYVSDMIGKSDRNVLMPLILNDGKILRCDRPAMPSMDCLTTDPTSSKRIFKIQNTCGDCGVIVAFNLDNDNKPVSGSISPKDIFEIYGDEFAVYEHFSRELKIISYDEEFDLTLNSNEEFKLYIIGPIKNGFFPIGRIDKYISPKTIKCIINEEIELFENGEYAYVKDGKLIIKTSE